MSKKISFFDIDGTMINVPNGLLSPTQETIRVLNEFICWNKYKANRIML
ncbi:MAG: hypothetical protein GX258_04340 [Clostridiales bacterium]|nr:hypothetical protein [Clostridiales bacterium]